MKSLKVSILTILLLALFIGIASCNQVPATVVATIAPTATTRPAPTATAFPTLEPGDSTHKLTVNNQERSYSLHVPVGMDNSQPASVVLVFHGAGEQPTEMQQATGFLVVYPEGLGLTWNAGICCGYAVENKIDDTAFVRQIVSDLETITNVDPKRIYATGFSNGALLVYQLACQMSDVLAGIAPVAGLLVYSPCQPEQPVSVLHVHGGADTTAPYAGGGDLNLPPVEQGISTWVKVDDCDNSPKVETVQDIIKHTSYPSCQAGTAVELYLIDLGGHNWSTKYVMPASQIIWDFFAAHPKP